MSSSSVARPQPPQVGIDYRPALLSRAGISRAVRELGRALVTGEAATAVAGPTRAAAVEVRLFGHSLAACRVPIDDPRVERRLWRWPIPGRSLPALARIGLGADRLCGLGRGAVFHWTDYVYPPVTAARLVVTVHDVSFAVDDEFHGRAAGGVLFARCRDAVQRAVRVITPTRATAVDVTRHLGVAADRVRIIPFGVDHVLREQRMTAHPRAGRPFVLALGTLEPRKNHLRLIDAWQSLQQPRPDLVVIGAVGWQCEQVVSRLKDAHRASGTDAALVWHHAASDAAVFAHLQHAAVVAYPSLFEGFGFPPLEALALGRAVVAGRGDALRETLGDAPVWCDPRSVDSIADALREALASGGDPVGVAARRAHAANFRWADCAAAHRRLYAEVAGT